MIGLMMTPGTSGSITGTSGMGGVVGSGLSVIEKSGIGSWEGSTWGGSKGSGRLSSSLSGGGIYPPNRLCLSFLTQSPEFDQSIRKGAEVVFAFVLTFFTPNLVPKGTCFDNVSTKHIPNINSINDVLASIITIFISLTSSSNSTCAPFCLF